MLSMISVCVIAAYRLGFVSHCSITICQKRHSELQ